jgi:dynein heavy chain, axonemal
MDLLDSL